MSRVDWYIDTLPFAIYNLRRLVRAQQIPGISCVREEVAYMTQLDLDCSVARAPSKS